MWLRRFLVVSALGASMAWPAVGRTDPNSCGAAYEKAQEERSDGHLRAARRQLELCVAPTCPDFVRNDCGRWLGEIESAMPSVVLVAKVMGKEVEDVQVSLDGEPLASLLDGKAVLVDPGHHTLRFLRKGAEPVTIELAIREGEKNRLISTDLDGRAPTPAPSLHGTAGGAPAPASSSGGPAWLPYAVGGVGLLGIAGFATFGLVGNSQKADREKTCAPECSSADVGSVRTMYHLADVSLGVGVVAFGVATYLFLSRPSKPGAQATDAKGLAFELRPTPGGAVGQLGARF